MISLFHERIFIGLDTSGSRKPFTFAVLDAGQRLIAQGEGELEEVLAFAAAPPAACIAINAPQRPHMGLVRQGEKNQSLMPLHAPGRTSEMRLAEYQLRQHGIHVSSTPGREETSPQWMQAGFSVYRKLADLGYRPFPTDGAAHTMLETHPHAAFCALIGQSPLPRTTLEGRLQRQLVLYEHGLDIKDPMDFFEEITRHRLIKGVLPTEHVYPAEMLDALAAAYTAYKAATEPHTLTCFGDPNEGLVYLPGTLAAKY